MSQLIPPYTVIDNDEDYLADTIMAALEASRVCRIDVLPDGYLSIGEHCDDFYWLKLTPEQVRLLAAELTALVEGMPEP